MDPHTRDYHPWFDGLRFFLACTVMAAHSGLYPERFDEAGLAVDVFFALSGWLIGGILVRMDSRELSRFYFNRAVRIWVPYFLALALVVAASLLKDPITLRWLEYVAYKALFVYNIFGPPDLAEHRFSMPLDASSNHFWSVNAEEQFYLVAPLLIVLLARRGGRSLTLWVLLAGAAYWWHRYAAIGFGVVAALAAHRFEAQLTRPVLNRIGFALAAAGAVGIWQTGNTPWVAPFFSVGVVLILLRPGTGTPLLRTLGGLSYPLYLNHWIGVFIANALLKPWGGKDSTASQVISFVLNVGIAWALYAAVDRPLIRRRESLFTDGRARLAMAFGFGSVAVGLALGFWLDAINW